MLDGCGASPISVTSKTVETREIVGPPWPSVMLRRTTRAVTGSNFTSRFLPMALAAVEGLPLFAVLGLQLEGFHAHAELHALVDHGAVEGLRLAEVHLQPARAGAGVGGPARLLVAVDRHRAGVVVVLLVDVGGGGLLALGQRLADAGRRRSARCRSRACRVPARRWCRSPAGRISARRSRCRRPSASRSPRRR